MRFDLKFVDFSNEIFEVQSAGGNALFQLIRGTNGATAGIGSRIYSSNGLGWDPWLRWVPEGTRVRGYFQSWRYFAAGGSRVITRDRVLPKEGVTDWFEDLRFRARRQRPIALHFRRGDYRKLCDEFGLLEAKYYEDALAALRERCVEGPIWVFSDEPKAAEETLSELDYDFQFVIPPGESHPGETLHLMALSSAHVLSNSSFAWWGAALNSGKPLVFFPKPWFRGLKAPSKMWPPTWLPINHSWEAVRG